MRLLMRKKVWLDARAALTQHRAERIIRVAPPEDASSVTGRLSYREVLRRAAAAAAAAVAEAGTGATLEPNQRR